MGTLRVLRWLEDRSMVNSYADKAETGATSGNRGSRLGGRYLALRMAVLSWRCRLKNGQAFLSLSAWRFVSVKERGKTVLVGVFLIGPPVIKLLCLRFLAFVGVAAVWAFDVG